MHAPPHPASSDLDGRVAEWVAQEVDAGGGRLLMRCESLAYAFAEFDFDDKSRTRIGSALTANGLRCAPPLAAADPDGLIEVARSAAADDQSPWFLESLPVRRDALIREEAAAAGPSRALLAGALIPLVLLALAGFGNDWLYGVVLVAAGGLAFVVARFRPAWILRVWFPRPRHAALRRFGLGAWPVVLACALAGLVVIAPISAGRTATAHRHAASVLVAEAERSLDASDASGAARLLIEARHLSGSAAGLDQAETRLAQLEQRNTHARARKAARARDAVKLRNAKAAMAAKHYHRAITTLDALGVYPGAKRLATRYRLVAARAIARQARTQLPAHPRIAIRLARLAASYKRVPAATSVITTAQHQLTVAHAKVVAAKHAAATRLAAARAERQRLAKEAAAKRAEEERQRAAAADAAAASACNPNYAGACLPNDVGDIDCADVPTTVTVVGIDEYGLDGDGDGYGCE